MKVLKCRACGSKNLKSIIDFGRTPLADNLLTHGQLYEPEITEELELVFCPECMLVQITVSVPPEVLFCRNYPYFSSVSPALLSHFADSAHDIMKMRRLNQESLVVEAASNDGYMLKNFKEEGITVLGIDPAERQAKIANDAGIATLCTFFGKKLAKELSGEGKKCDVFLANNVLAHVPDLNGFVEGVAVILKNDGMAVIEVPYLIDLVENCEFDTIYHQHLCYFSVTALDNLFRRHGLYLNDIKHVWIHGGSLRLFVEKKEAVKSSVKGFLDNERERKVSQIAYYREFVGRIEDIRQHLCQMLHEIKRSGKKIAGYGAAAKATTLLSYFQIDKGYLDYIADLSRFKHGLFMGINHLPIVPPPTILQDQPDYVLILAWNFADEIMKQQEEYHKRGGRFIVPIPQPRVI